MMIVTQVDLGGLDKALSNAVRLRAVKTGLASAALELAGEFKRYPPVRRGKQPFRTRKQQRAFFAMLRKGQIDVPYVRGSSRKSQKLGQSWTTKASAGGLTQTVGTAVRYAKWVHDDREQSQYHKVTGWRTVTTVAKAFAPRVPIIIQAQVAREL